MSVYMCVYAERRWWCVCVREAFVVDIDQSLFRVEGQEKEQKDSNNGEMRGSGSTQTTRSKDEDDKDTVPSIYVVHSFESFFLSFFFYISRFRSHSFRSSASGW